MVHATRFEKSYGGPRRHDEGDQQGKEHRSAGADRNGPQVRSPQTTDESHGQDGRHNRERGEDGRIANFVNCLDRHLKGWPRPIVLHSPVTNDVLHHHDRVIH